MKPARILLTVPLAATIAVALFRGTRHLSWGWAVHAQHHLVGHITTSVGLGIVGLWLVWGPLGRREGWSLGALAVLGLCNWGGFWLANLWVGLGEPALMPNLGQGIQTALYALGLLVGWRAMRTAQA